MDIAVVHHLPPSGGAWRVLAEYVARRPQHRFTVYTRMPEPQQVLTPLAAHAEVRRFPLPEPASRLGRLRALRELPERGRELAATIDAGGHDVAFVHASSIVQAHEVLPHLRTPALAYAPEPLRAIYERPPATTLRDRLVHAGLDPYERLRKRIDRDDLRAARHVVTHSQFTAGELARIYGVRAEVVPLGVDAEALAPPAGADRTRSVLSVGALHRLKGHDFVIEALAKIPAPQRPPLTVVGDRGEQAGTLRELAARHGVELELLQAIPFSELKARYHAAGVMACGQRREPFGLITLEAMAAGVPVVAVAEGGFLETVRDGETGVLVPRDAAAFGAAIAGVIDDPGAAAAMARRGREDVTTNWTWERTARGYDALLERIAEHR
jgi:glycosyltransferase involved in cell wall biosynthesis